MCLVIGKLALCFMLCICCAFDKNNGKHGKKICTTYIWRWHARMYSILYLKCNFYDHCIYNYSTGVVASKSFSKQKFKKNTRLFACVVSIYGAGFVTHNRRISSWVRTHDFSALTCRTHDVLQSQLEDEDVHHLRNKSRNQF
jgi:hypothetical protein